MALSARDPRPPGVAVAAIAVVVPAHNEQKRLPAALRAVERAAARVRVPVRTVVVLDACTDGTPRVVPAHVHTVTIEARCVGAARAAGCAAALRAHGTATDGLWLASTDADSLVPVDWLEVQVASARDHDVFVGTVCVRDWHLRPHGVAGAHDAAYRRVPGHPHVHGANLGLSASAYAHVGGFPQVRVGEDQALVDACQRAGLAIDRSAAAVVETSARRSHRAPGGFSDTLTDLEEMPA